MTNTFVPKNVDRFLESSYGALKRKLLKTLWKL